MLQWCAGPVLCPPLPLMETTTCGKKEVPVIVMVPPPGQVCRLDIMQLWTLPLIARGLQSYGPDRSEQQQPPQ